MKVYITKPNGWLQEMHVSAAQSSDTATLKEKQWVYCMAQEVSPLLLSKKRKVHSITHHKPLLARISKDVAMLPQCLQCIMLSRHLYSVQLLYNLNPKLFTADWLSYHNHIENQAQEILGMNVSIHTISTLVDIPVSTSIENIKA